MRVRFYHPRVVLSIFYTACFVSPGSQCKLKSLKKKVPDPHTLPPLRFLNIQLYENEDEDKKPCIVSKMHPSASALTPLTLPSLCCFSSSSPWQAAEMPLIWRLIGCECFMVLCLYQDLRVCVCVLILIWEICITLPLLLAKQALWSRDNNIIMKMKCVGIEANSNSRSGKYYYNTSQNASNKTQIYFITAREMIITSMHNFKNSISTSLSAALTHFRCKVQLNLNHLIHNLINFMN